MNIDLTEKMVFLTGASQGIGHATLIKLLESGARVLATDKHHSTLLENTYALKEKYQQTLILEKLDLADFQNIQISIPKWAKQYGDIDHFVHCAGILHLTPLLTATTESLTDTFNVNVLGATLLLQELGKMMKKRSQGNIVVVGSNAANTPRANMGSYAASKAALHMMVKCLGMELAPWGIRCNIVSPGSTRTAMQMQLWNESYGEQDVIDGNSTQFRLGIPLGKIAEPNDIAESILFLMSDAANHITLHDLRVDGGATLDN